MTDSNIIPFKRPEKRRESKSRCPLCEGLGFYKVFYTPPGWDPTTERKQVRVVVCDCMKNKK